MYVAYIHGFLSGPQAIKSTILQKYIKENEKDCIFVAPDHPDTPNEAYDYLISYFEDLNQKAKQNNEEIVLIGSSMGGFFATILHNKYGYRAVLLNPCIHPQNYFKDLIGEHENPVTGRTFELKPSMLEDLKRMDKMCEGFDKNNLLVMLQDDDDVLDYKVSLEFFGADFCNVGHGGKHTFTNFDDYLKDIFTFLHRG